MRPLRADEERVRIVLERALGVPVEQHDDGSEPSMHDLDIVYPDRAVAALEITAAADSDSIELWRAMNDGERWCEENLEGGWSITVDPAARGKLLREHLPEFLRGLEGAGVREFRRGYGHPEELERAAARLKVVSAFQGGTEFPGSIYPMIELPPERSGGFVGETGDPLACWLGEFLHDVRRADVRRKLARSGATETHAFVVALGFSPAPFGVTDLLIRDDPPPPRIDPSLPDEIGEVWAASSWTAGRVFRWSERCGWQTFDKW
jgi:hypothetical protein